MIDRRTAARPLATLLAEERSRPWWRRIVG
jgi:hypothetical protein